MSSLLEAKVVPELENNRPNRHVFFTPEQLSLLDKERIPKHVAIIPDGNRRWAKKLELNSSSGHREGADILMDVVKSGQEMGIKALTFYTFSTENWHRNTDEVHGLLWLLQTYLSDKCQEMLDFDIRFQCIGDLSKLPADLYNTIVETKKVTANCKGIEMVLAVNYGSRDELCRAIKKMVDDCKEDKIKEENITAELVSSYLDTNQWPDPELLIRTSGEMRISNFLLWQLSYSEIYVTSVLWPDYKPHHLFDAVYKYQQRERRLGGP
jgi:undecaprenyl diphosphate synthase